MKVFISWSGALSKKVAELLNDWIPNVIQSAEPWFSADDISKGDVWFTSIGDAINASAVGIICLTNENLNAPWIHFEAGGLSKGITKNRVCTFLIDVESQDLKPPLSQFNATKAMKEDVAKLLISINAMDKEKALPEDRIKRAFEQWWPTLENGLKGVLMEIPLNEIKIERTQGDITAEILETVRSIQKMVQEDNRDIPFCSYPATLPWKVNPDWMPSEMPNSKLAFVNHLSGIALNEGIRIFQINETKSVDQIHTALTVSKIPSDAMKTSIEVLAAQYGKGKVTYHLH